MLEIRGEKPVQRHQPGEGEETHKNRMYIEIPEGEHTHHRIDADDGMTVVVYVAFVNPVPVVHVVVILVKIGRIVTNAEDHLEKILRLFPQGIDHYFAVVEIFENISGGPVGVVEGVNKIHKYPGKYLQYKYNNNSLNRETFDAEKFYLVYQ